MAIRITETITADGHRFKQMLQELAKKEVRIGFQHGDATSEDGTDICDIAMWNEMGTVHSPSRPFLRNSVDNNVPQIKSFVKSQKDVFIRSGNAETVLKNIGLFQKDLIQNEIVSGSFAPNAESTIKKKGSDKPLIDTGRMRQSVNYVIKPKGSDD